jgi:peptidyl-prolyl cis-trans isomerase B (cyclophilin B)
MAIADADHLVRRAAIEALEEGGREDDPWSPHAAHLAVGPVETGWDLRVYQQAAEIARGAREAVLETATGTLRIQLFGDDAPLTVHNFVRLAESGYFDNGAWHRVVPDFVVQDGCPRTDGWGGPGHTIRCEINMHHYEPGMLGMALSGKDTGGSQFFLTLSAQPHLDGRYTIFGRLIEGWDVMQAIGQGEVIRSVRITE